MMSNSVGSLVEVGIQPFKYTKYKPCEQVPPPRSGHRVVCSSKYLYCFGGFNPRLDQSFIHALWSWNDWNLSRPLFEELWRYNICTRQWKKLSCRNIPKALASSSVVLSSSGKFMIVFGGTGYPFGELRSRSLHVCDLSKEDLSFELWETTGDLPEPLYGQGIFLDNINLYTVGGTCGRSYSNDVHRLNLVTKTWERLEPTNPQDCPAPRYRHELAFYRGEIYIFGGGTSSSTFSLREIPVFDLISREWKIESTIPHLEKGHQKYPQPRKCHSLVQIPSQPHLVIICGGINRSGALSDSWMLDLVSKRWQPLPLCSLPDYALHFHDSAVTPSGKMFTFGGIKTKIACNSPIEERSNDVYEAWIGIPKLSELSFQILLEAYPEIKALSKEQLQELELGIPREFLVRLFDDGLGL